MLPEKSQQMTKTIELSVENSVKLCAIVFSYRVNAFYDGGLSSQQITFVPL